MQAEVESDIIGIDEVADLLQVSTKSIRRHLNDYPHVRIGRAIRFSRRVILSRFYKDCRRAVPRPSPTVADARIAW